MILEQVVFLSHYRKANCEKYKAIRLKGQHIVSNQQTISELLEETGGSDFGLPKLVRTLIFIALSLFDNIVSTEVCP